MESQLATYLQSLANGLLVFTSIVGAYLSVHYGNVYNAISLSYSKVINLEKEMLETDGNRENIKKNARLVRDILSNYSYNLLSVDNTLTGRMRHTAQYLLILSAVVWFLSLVIIVSTSNYGMPPLKLFFYNDFAYFGLLSFMLTVIGFMLCWKFLFKNKYMFDEFPRLREKLDVSKDTDMFDVMLFSTLSSVYCDYPSQTMTASLAFIAPFSGLAISAKVVYHYSDDTQSEEKIAWQPFIVHSKDEKVGNSRVFSIKGSSYSFAIPSQTKEIAKIKIVYELVAGEFKGSIIIIDVPWERANRYDYYPQKQFIGRFLTPEELENFELI